MKRTFLTLFAVCVAVLLSAQNTELSQEQGIEKYLELRKSLGKVWDKKNFSEMEKILNQQIDIVNLLSKEDKEQFIWLKNDVLYNFACLYSLQNKKKKALQTFEECVKFNYNDYQHILQDTDLDNIRNDNKFKELLKIIRERSDFVYILQQAEKYEQSDTAGLPQFTYQSEENGNLRDVRRYFKLDSIAGDGDEILKILNLMYWVHNNIRHDGNNWALAECDAIDLYNYHKATGKGINCRLLAITLNEMYLAMGICSRYVTCLPKSTTDTECHVINAVFSQTLKKWIWIDPTNAAYIKDENGNFLGIAETRARLIDGRPLVLNEDANWNNENLKTKEDYLYNYMAKNLYRFQCPVNSCFNPESRYRNNNQTYVSLNPSDYEYKNPYVEDIVTHDEKYFWED